MIEVNNINGTKNVEIMAAVVQKSYVNFFYDVESNFDQDALNNLYFEEDLHPHELESKKINESKFPQCNKHNDYIDNNDSKFESQEDVLNSFEIENLIKKCNSEDEIYEEAETNFQSRLIVFNENTNNNLKTNLPRLSFEGLFINKQLVPPKINFESFNIKRNNLFKEDEILLKRKRKNIPQKNTIKDYFRLGGARNTKYSKAITIYKGDKFLNLKPNLMNLKDEQKISMVSYNILNQMYMKNVYTDNTS